MWKKTQYWRIRLDSNVDLYPSQGWNDTWASCRGQNKSGSLNADYWDGICILHSRISCKVTSARQAWIIYMPRVNRSCLIRLSAETCDVWIIGSLGAYATGGHEPEAAPARPRDVTLTSHVCGMKHQADQERPDCTVNINRVSSISLSESDRKPWSVRPLFPYLVF